MDYKKKYNEALKWMRELYPGLHGATKEDAEHYFPELRENEDERIRKEIIEYLKLVDKGEGDYAHPMVSGWIAWLEKQKEQKPAGWSEEDETYLQDALWCIEQAEKVAKDEGDMGACWSARRWLKSLRPQPHWKPSEQEKGALRTAIHILTEERNFPKAASHLQAILDAFDGKESRKDWKPSEEQMDRLVSIVTALRKDYCDDMADFLANLHADLKKLGVKEEPEYYQHFDPDC